MVLTAIRLIRIEHPFYGLRKVWHEIQEVHRIMIGRDRLHRLMQANDLMLPKRYKAIRTTVPGILLPSVENKIKHLDITHKNQVWVTDITYIQTHEGVVYLSAIMDLWSRSIIAYHVSNDLKADSSLECLRKALDTIDAPRGIIHHSDRGVQYCSYVYVNHLLSVGMEISYTGKDHCYDNANIERFFNTVKHEYGLVKPLRDRKLARQVITKVIRDYNYGRIHKAINYKKPGELYDAA
jgi:putative transposase